ncbi:potassium transporter [Boudabousia liubingyangii]|uniref:Potassium transporter n=1 Tax=Boudabousia liubingyangii TaxID=1921764 RepID=A0A1Q5PLN4_9ACTO|nr:TrkA family potassium uptake protein [Boudabousia liubingyangii]OKL46923.1 potassium transporter [Boudabousia liubingyangii]OKL47968.1 potassium transporter [Boudabousia liubingyangii]
MADRSRNDASTLVIGLGRFGSAVAATLDRLGQEILVVEQDPAVAERWTGRIPLVQADATSADALKQVGAADFTTAVVGVGTSLEASVLITANLVDLGNVEIWAKATSPEHGRILRRIGAHHVVYPEFDAGQRTAHLVGGRMLDYIELERNGFAVVKMLPPREIQGFTIAESEVQSKYGVKIIGVMSPGQQFEYATKETRVDRDDILIVSGDSALLDAFGRRP